MTQKMTLEDIEMKQEELDLEKDYGFAQDRKQIKEKRYKQGGGLRIQKK